MVLLGLMAAPPVSAEEVLENFDNTANLLNRFTPVSSPQFSSQADSGIGNTGSINVPLGSQDIWTTKTAYSVAGIGDVYELSAYSKLKANSGYGGLGFTSDNSSEPLYRGSITHGVGVTFHGGGGAFENNGSPTNPTWGAGDLTLGNWYKFVYTLTATAANTFNVSVVIHNSDANGVLGSIRSSKSLSNVVNTDIGGC